MNTNDNYLWDRTGEPDAEVQQLEEVLGALKYQPRPLPIPATMNVRRRPRFLPLAVAAAIALLLIGAGLWFRFANSNASRTDEARRETQPTATPGQQPAAPQDSLAVYPETPVQAADLPKQRKVTQVLAVYKPRRTAPAPARALTDEELAQKEQVLVALRLVSAKLNLAQRKAQGLPQVNSIRNHKIG